MRTTSLLLLAVPLLAACGGSSPTPEPTPAPAVAHPAVVSGPLRPVPHEGPLSAEPNVYDCGAVPDLAHCDFEVLLTNRSSDELIIRSVSQDASPYAAIGLVDDRTGFDRDLPYTMGSENLRLLFSYRRDHPDDRVDGALYVEYRRGDQALRLEVPVRAGRR